MVTLKYNELQAFYDRNRDAEKHLRDEIAALNAELRVLRQQTSPSADTVPHYDNELPELENSSDYADDLSMMVDSPTDWHRSPTCSTPNMGWTKPSEHAFTWDGRLRHNTPNDRLAPSSRSTYATTTLPSKNAATWDAPQRCKTPQTHNTPNTPLKAPQAITTTPAKPTILTEEDAAWELLKTQSTNPIVSRLSWDDIPDLCDDEDFTSFDQY
jgi:hypothetical protein